MFTVPALFSYRTILMPCEAKITFANFNVNVFRLDNVKFANCKFVSATTLEIYIYFRYLSETHFQNTIHLLNMFINTSYHPVVEIGLFFFPFLYFCIYLPYKFNSANGLLICSHNLRKNRYKMFASRIIYR